MIKLYEAFSTVIPIYIVLFISIFIFLLFIHKKLDLKLESHAQKYQFFNVFMLMMSVIGIILVTLLPSTYPERITQFVPFLSIIETWKYATTHAIINSLLMNIVLFIPCGFFMYLVARRKRLVIFYVLFLTIFVEFLQYMLPIGRISNIDDVILNTMGGIIGMILGRMFNGMIKRMRRDRHR